MAKYDKVIPPGQAGTIELSVDGDRVHNRFSKAATVTTNDPKHQKLTLTLSGNIIPYISLTPRSRIYLTGEYGEKVEQEITISSNEEKLKKTFEVKSVESTLDDKITYKVEKTDLPGQFKLKIWKNPYLTAGNQFGTLTIHSNSEHMPASVVQVQINTKSEMVLRPSILNFGTFKEPLDKKESQKQQSLIISNSKRNFKIDNITFSQDGYRAKVEPVKEGSSYKVTVDFFPKAGGQNFMGEMILHTTDPLEPEIKVRLISRLGSG